MAWWNEVIQLIHTELSHPIQDAREKAARADVAAQAAVVLQSSQQELQRAQVETKRSQVRLQTAQNALNDLLKVRIKTDAHRAQVLNLAKRVVQESELQAVFDQHMANLTQAESRLRARTEKFRRDLTMAETAQQAVSVTQTVQAQGARGQQARAKNQSKTSSDESSTKNSSAMKGGVVKGHARGFAQQRPAKVMNVLRALSDRAPAVTSEKSPGKVPRKAATKSTTPVVNVKPQKASASVTRKSKHPSLSNQTSTPKRPPSKGAKR